MSSEQYIKNNKQVNRLVTFSVIAFFLTGGGSAFSQQDGDDNRRDRRHNQTLSTSLSRALYEVQESLLNEHYNQALEKLGFMLSRDDDLKRYDKAKMLEMLTVAHMGLEQYRQAADAAEQALRLDVLESASHNQLHQRLFYLYFFLEDYAKAIGHIEVWFELEQNPDIQSHFTAAQIYALAGQMDKALSFALKGMDLLRNSPERKPRENWYQLLVSIYLKDKNYQDVAGILEGALSLWPQRKDYYLQLSAVYRELNRERESLAILSIAYQNHLLNREFDLDRLLQLYRYFDYPFKGAVIFSKALEKKNIKPDEKHWQALANAWLQARERSWAEAAFQQAAGLADIGNHWLRLCQIAFQDERWTDSRHYCEAALKKGGLEEEEGVAWYLIALGRYYENRLVEAKEVFERCMNWSATRQDCEQWHAHLTQVLRNRKEELERVWQENMENEERRRQLRKQVEKALI